MLGLSARPMNKSESERESEWESESKSELKKKTILFCFLLLHPYNEKIIQIFAQGANTHAHIVKVEYECECENGCECECEYNEYRIDNY